MPPNFFLQKNLSVFFLSPQKITGFIIFYCLLPVVFRKTFHSTPQQFSAFLFEILMFSFKDTPKFIATCFSIFSSRNFFPLKFFLHVLYQEITFGQKSCLPIFFPQQKSLCCVLSSQESKYLPLHCWSNYLFQQRFHLFLQDMICTKYTKKFCLFHIYEDIYAPLITFLGT